MSVEKIRHKVIASIWQAIAQSDVDLSSVPQEQQEQLVSRIADNVLITVDQVLEEPVQDEPVQEQMAEEEVDQDEEKVLWQGRPFLSMVERYTITTERIKIVKGLLSRDVENFELIRIQDIDMNQDFDERVFGIGDITIHGQDASTPRIVLRNVSKPEQVYEILRKAWLEARKRHGLQFREYM